MTDPNAIRWEQSTDGVVTLTLDDPGQRANTMNDAFRASLAAAVERLTAEKDTITGVIVTSAKDSFLAGGDLRQLIRVTDSDAPRFSAQIEQVKGWLRTLETLGKPVVAALNGSALGGGLELALACHHRIALDTPHARFGLPEVTFGLLPGGGGVARTTRLLGVVDALTKVLLEGNRYPPAEAVRLGLVDELAATREELLDKARAWITAHPHSVQRWDAADYAIPGGAPGSPGLAATLPALPATLRKKLRGAPLPAPHHILAAAVEGAQLDLDGALRVEGRYFVDIARGQTAKNMIQAFWFDLNTIKAGGSRPKDLPRRRVSKAAVLGAGMMGAGIAYACARSGIDVVLKDISLQAAERGKDYSRRLLDSSVKRGRLSEAGREEVLARITPSAEYADLTGCDLVVEAVFEDASLKRAVFAEAERVVADDALLGSNTSTLPVSGLAEGVNRQKDFVGLHFFSPVDRMPLLEVVRGERTSDEALARALDFAAQIGKTPIVVNDSRGFFTSRVIGTFVYEALAMLGEGIAPATVEQAAWRAGYPVGALQLADELNLELLLRIRDEKRAADGDDYRAHPAEAVAETMTRLGRPGRARGAGFYDYDASGARTGLWPGLVTAFPPHGDPAGIDLHELTERLLFAEAVEAAHCVAEGVLTSTADANIGSLLGIGFPPWTGGVLQYINGYPGGLPAFVARADRLAAAHGERFAPNALLREKAEHGETF
ncbi:3-hydroxyacyl-CoA dehydrogenase NAD-binding domain-containing protein [Streptomyces sp. NPDC050211]|uniref:3-hydroxyacyl-CoA dehydrogenase NAD-binding domain-containing protein n=1 Tax=Streptomyces sp. NPDC050211 TaxID=3154932 RepID=UPI00343D78B8